MQPINWQQFGLKKDPYDTVPLVEGGDLPIEKAFIGRQQEKSFLDSLFESTDRACLTICGDVGVGKTSLVNFNKFIWKYRTPKLLFSFRREIEANGELLNKRAFLIEIIGSVLREIKLLDPNLLKNDLLMKINQVVDINQSIAFSAGINYNNIGFSGSREKIFSQPAQFSVATLEGYFNDLIDFIKNHEIRGNKYSGLIVHVNNFDVVLSDPETKKKAVVFFGEIRDMLQIPNVYYLFLGPNNLFKDIISTQQRVKGIFVQTPLRVKPLSKSEIVDALNERLEILKSDDVSKVIKPVEDNVVFRLYDLYEGDIRSIMTAIGAILSQCSEKLAHALTEDEAMLLLGQERWNNIETVIKLTDEQKEILKYLATAHKFISQKEIASMFNKAQSNTSSYYFKPLRDNNIIEEKERKGKVIYYGLTQHYTPLQWLLDAKTNLNREMKEKVEQLSLPR